MACIKFISHYSKIVATLVILALPSFSYAQQPVTGDIKIDTKQAETVELETQSTHSPTKAAWMSAVLPGLGQAYNKKYLKMGLVYVAIGATVYSFDFANDKHKLYKDALSLRTDGDSTTIDKFDGVYDESQLITLQDFYRRNRDLSVIVGVGIYLLNIVDAYVDAHLLDFEVNDDLSFKIRPESFKVPGTNQNSLGLQLNIRF